MIHIADVLLNLHTGDAIRSISLADSADQGPLRVAIVDRTNSTSWSLAAKEDIECKSLSLTVRLSCQIKKWRNFNYQWVDYKKGLIASAFATKALLLEDNSIFAGSVPSGCWETTSSPYEFIWHLYHPEMFPVFQFKGSFREFSKSCRFPADSCWRVGLVSGAPGVIPEWSRSPDSFRSVAVFTDHCDFDTAQLLKAQRELLRAANIKITKCFFLMPEPENRSNVVNLGQSETLVELRKWRVDGHELAYHSLYNELRRNSILDRPLRDLSVPEGLGPIRTWIDHGYHNYNFTQNALDRSGLWSNWIRGSDVEILWNYLDSYDGSPASLNQLDRHGTSITAYIQHLKATRRAGARTDWQGVIRNLLRYNTNEELTRVGLQLGMVVKDRTARSVGLIVGLLKALVSETVLNRRFWRELCSHFPRPSAHNYFSPLLFPAPGQRPEEQNVFLFQTLAIRDFVATFSKAALERFTDQYGVFIAHTYFAFLGAHHSGKPFLDREGGLNADAQRALGLLGKAITDGKVWNPPLSELHSFWSRLLKMELRYENRQWIWINAPAGLATRWLR